MIKCEIYAQELDHIKTKRKRKKNANGIFIMSLNWHLVVHILNKIFFFFFFAKIKVYLSLEIQLPWKL